MPYAEQAYAAFVKPLAPSRDMRHINSV